MQSVLRLQKGSRPWQQTAALILRWKQSYLSRSIQPHCLSLSQSLVQARQLQDAPRPPEDGPHFYHLQMPPRFKALDSHQLSSNPSFLGFHLFSFSSLASVLPRVPSIHSVCLFKKRLCSQAGI
ncbi:hypothetical protein Q8A67_020289 [Cirrhinus molitorella]|uniref:Uncharacterized protein n=1 Tax=Cirrhinus molitorella TaxID=172907 RepID=A0AA88PBK1_9TELE|nr:hypothetical protein Q8A67_020289 [Cirrhinus molitorella]